MGSKQGPFPWVLIAFYAVPPLLVLAALVIATVLL